MEISSCILGALFGTALLAVLAPLPSSDLYEIDPRYLAEVWDKEHVSPPDPHSLKHMELKQRLRLLEQEFPETTRTEQAGNSTHGREIYLLSLGAGPEKILLWSQMHGDESTATSALLDLAHFLGRHRQDSWVAEILKKYTLLCIPMLNPDGAERPQRRNAQGIDINRDARMLETPEGRVLKSVRDRFKPFLGFNLHDQNSLTTVGDTGKVATIALLAVAADLPATLTPSGASDKPQATHYAPQSLAKQVTAVLYEALSALLYGHISRYDDTYNPRAFGDNMTLWGTPVVLIESGGNPAGQPANFGVKLNFVGLLATFNSLACGRMNNANPAVFDALKMNSDTPIYDLMLRNAWICNGTGVPIFKGDVAIRRDMRANMGSDAIIADLGDLGILSAHETIDCTGALVTPGLIAWDPQQSLFARSRPDGEYLGRGIVTVLETAPWNELGSNKGATNSWKIQPRSLNWGFVVVGEPPRQDKSDELLLAEWLAAGGRGWIRESAVGGNPSEQPGKIPSWFGVEALAGDVAAQFGLPAALAGDPAKVLPRWTSEAARYFNLSRRGTVAVGAVADLIVWTTASPRLPIDMRDCRPKWIIINGRRLDLSQAVQASNGKFLGR